MCILQLTDISLCDILSYYTLPDGDSLSNFHVIILDL